MKFKELEIYQADTSSLQELPLSESGVHAGFPSPADDFMDLSLDLNRELVRNPAATFYARVKGDSMIDEGITEGDLLLIDKSVDPFDGCLAVCFVDGEFTLKRFKFMGDHALLVPANAKYKPIRVSVDDQFAVWGVVRYIIKKV